VTDRKTWAIVLGAAAGVTIAVTAITWYAQSHEHPELRTVQDKIQWAHERLEQLENVADEIKKKPESA